MPWEVLEHPDFSEELEALPPAVADKLSEVVRALTISGPQLGRPLVDTLGEGKNTSKHPNMKEIRFKMEGVWRFAFAFDPDRNAVLLCGGDKEGENRDRFYKGLIRLADERFDEWLEAEDDENA